MAFEAALDLNLLKLLLNFVMAVETAIGHFFCRGEGAGKLFKILMEGRGFVHLRH